MDVLYSWDSELKNWFAFEKVFYSRMNVSKSSEKDILVFPNPVKGALFIELPEELEFDHFELYDLSGRIIIVSRERIAYLSSLTKGIYILRLKDKTGGILRTLEIMKE